MRRKKSRLIVVLFFLSPLLLTLASLSIGRYHIPPVDLGKTLVRTVSPASFPEVPPEYRDILLRIRLPRLMLALLAGAALSVSGASLQALFKNPLVNEYILGISFGAAFGAALSLVFLGKGFPPQIAAFVFALGAVLAVLLVSGRSGSHTVSLLLTGIIVAAFFQALLSLVEFFANPYALQSLFFWLMGSLSLATWGDLAVSLPIMAMGTVALILMRWRLNVLSLSEEEARGPRRQRPEGEAPGHRPDLAEHGRGHGGRRRHRLDRAHRAPPRPDDGRGGQPEGPAAVGGPRGLGPHRRRRHHPRRGLLRDPHRHPDEPHRHPVLHLPPGKVAKGVAVSVEVRALYLRLRGIPALRSRPALREPQGRLDRRHGTAPGNRRSSSSWAASCRLRNGAVLLDGRDLAETEEPRARPPHQLRSAGAGPAP